MAFLATMRISRFHLSAAAASTGSGAASTETEMRAQARTRTRTGRQRTFIVRVRRLEAGDWRPGGDLGPASLLYIDW